MANGTDESREYCYQYAAKIICTAHIPGTSQTSSAVLPGAYMTAVNIHNPSRKETRYRVKLVLAEPSAFKNGALAPNHGTRWDCDRITNAFGPFIHGFEGFLVIESNNSLDVTAVYTAGKIGEQVESIDVEQIRERYLEEKPCSPPPPTEGLDHFKVYEVDEVEVDFGVRLRDQFENNPKEAHLRALRFFANPTRKEHSGGGASIKDANGHLNWYAIEQEQPEPRRTIRFINQFGQHSVDIKDPKFLLVPTQKISDEGSEFPKSLDHYKCYEVIQVNSAPEPPVVTLGDQFVKEEAVKVRKPRFFCLPVIKERENGEVFDIMNEEDHLAVYDISPKDHQVGIAVKDQFEEREVKVIRSVMLAVPTKKQAVVAHED
ncbi:MAG: hypothetical protein ACK2UV_21670 [Candidatus Promineifilaceae bacterium]|jgi:hypothetical protein